MFVCYSCSLPRLVVIGTAKARIRATDVRMRKTFCSGVHITILCSSSPLTPPWTHVPFSLTVRKCVIAREETNYASINLDSLQSDLV